jgi:hypothetical protein
MIKAVNNQELSLILLPDSHYAQVAEFSIRLEKAKVEATSKALV